MWTGQRYYWYRFIKGGSKAICSRYLYSISLGPLCMFSWQNLFGLEIFLLACEARRWKAMASPIGRYYDVLKKYPFPFAKKKKKKLFHQKSSLLIDDKSPLSYTNNNLATTVYIVLPCAITVEFLTHNFGRWGNSILCPDN